MGILVLIMIGITVCIHEMGHVLLAKKHKVSVEAMDFGFGPKLYSRNLKGTKVSLKLFLVGAATVFGDDTLMTTYNCRKDMYLVLKITLAGVLLNFFIGMSLMTFANSQLGVTVVDIKRDSMLSDLGIENKDRVIRIDESQLYKTDSVQKELLKNNRSDFDVFVFRDGAIKKIDVNDFNVQKWTIYDEESTLVGLKKWMSDIEFTFWEIKSMLGFVIRMPLRLSGITSPIGISSTMGERFGSYVESNSRIVSFFYGFWFLGFLNIMIGFMNLFPLPFLDGGKAVTLLLELIVGKRIEFFKWVHFIGLALFLAFGMYLLLRDLVKFSI